jgi:hypothetical protein
MATIAQTRCDALEDFFVNVLVDQTGWHKSKALIVPQNIRLPPQATT